MAEEIWTTVQLPSGQQQLTIPNFHVTVVKGKDKGLKAAAQSAELAIGTAQGADLRLNDPTISRNHCVIEARPDGFRIHDLGSTNGTFVNGLRVVEAVIQPGADISMGASVVRFQAIKEPLLSDLHGGSSFGNLVGRSTAMRQIFATLDRAAQVDSTVLLLGETGTGKDLAAEALHMASQRREKPLVVVDCGTLSQNLIESELFGHQRGAFTGAEATRTGAFEAATGGVVFLDEVGELRLDLQVKLLRVLESRTVRRVGDTQSRPVDVRVIAATNRDLRKEVNRGTFREDLFFRLSVIVVRIPPLRERLEDIPLLAEHFLRQLNAGHLMTEDLAAQLRVYPWLGNVRELRNYVEQLVAIGAAQLPELNKGQQMPFDVSPDSPFKQAKQALVTQFERWFLTNLLESTQGNVSAAARKTGLDRMHLSKLLKQYNIG
jgi:DNA-binding NtrC family response regulator